MNIVSLENKFQHHLIILHRTNMLVFTYALLELLLQISPFADEHFGCNPIDVNV